MVGVEQHLVTKYVFFDTQSLRAQQFDWSGPKFSKIKEFAAANQLRVLITEVTKREVRSHLREQFANASVAMEKHRIVLEQLGFPAFRLTITDDATAIVALDAAFERFLAEVKAIEVPLTVDAQSLVNSYFSRLPPFSEKKKSEFPDAIVIESLSAWCAKTNSTAYVVSADPDMKACCSGSPLHHAETVGDIISQATVSKAQLDALAEGLRDCDHLLHELAEQVKGRPVTARRMTQRDAEVAVSDGRVHKVDGVKIFHVNVLDRKGEKFKCELEFEAELEVGIQIDLEGEVDDDGYREPISESVSTTITYALIADLELVGPPTRPDEWTFESVYVHEDPVELSRSDLKDLFHFAFHRW